MIEHASEQQTTTDQVVEESGGELMGIACNSSGSLAGGLAAMAITASVIFGGYAVAKLAVHQVQKYRKPA